MSDMKETCKTLQTHAVLGPSEGISKAASSVKVTLVKVGSINMIKGIQQSFIEYSIKCSFINLLRFILALVMLIYLIPRAHDR